MQKNKCYKNRVKSISSKNNKSVEQLWNIISETFNKIIIIKFHS